MAESETVPTEVCEKIVAMRKDGLTMNAVAKELDLSIRNVQRVWQRYQVTGRIDDKRRSSGVGRPRKHSESSKVATYGSVAGNQPELAEKKSSSENPGNGVTTSNPRLPVIKLSGGARGGMSVPRPMEATAVPFVPTTHAPGNCAESQGNREALLLRLIEGCPLAFMRSMAAESGSRVTSSHLTNLTRSLAQPLSVDCLHTSGGVPDVFATQQENLHTTKVYFNACCKPSSLFDTAKVVSSLPFSVGPSRLEETLQAVLEVLLSLCTDPAAALDCLPSGNGMLLLIITSTGSIRPQGVPCPASPADYWPQLLRYAEALGCCPNFLSAWKPSAPCLRCHPCELLMEENAEASEERPVSSAMDAQQTALTSVTIHTDSPGILDLGIVQEQGESLNQRERDKPEETQTAPATPQTSLGLKAQGSEEQMSVSQAPPHSVLPYSSNQAVNQSLDQENRPSWNLPEEPSVIQAHDLALSQVKQDEYAESMEVDDGEVIVENSVLSSMLVESHSFSTPAVQLEDPAVVQVEGHSQCLVEPSLNDSSDSQIGNLSVSKTDHLSLHCTDASSSREQNDYVMENPSTEGSTFSQSDIPVFSLSETSVSIHSENPAMSQAENLSTSQAENLAMSQAEDPTMSQTENLAMSQAENPAMNQAESPAVSQAEDPTMSQAESPAVSQAENLAVSQAENPALNQAEDLAVSQAENPALNQAVSQAENLAVSQAENPAMNQAESPAMSQAEDPTMSQAENLAVNQAENPTLNQAEDLAVSQAENPALNQAESPAVSQAENLAVSQAENPALNQAESPAVSQADIPATLSQSENLTLSQADNPVLKQSENSAMKAENPAMSQAENPAVSQVENPAASQAENLATSQAENPATSQPENPATSQPENPATSQPENPATSRSENPSTSQAENPATSQPENPATSQPENPATSQPENSALSHGNPASSQAESLSESAMSQAENHTINQIENLAATSQSENPTMSQAENPALSQSGSQSREEKDQDNYMYLVDLEGEATSTSPVSHTKQVLDAHLDQGERVVTGCHSKIAAAECETNVIQEQSTIEKANSLPLECGTLPINLGNVSVSGVMPISRVLLEDSANNSSEESAFAQSLSWDQDKRNSVCCDVTGDRKPNTIQATTSASTLATAGASTLATAGASTLVPATASASTLVPATASALVPATASALVPATASASTLVPATASALVPATASALVPATASASTLVPATASASTLIPATASASTLVPATASASTLVPATASALVPATASASTLVPATASASTLVPATASASTLVPATASASTLVPATASASTLVPATASTSALVPATTSTPTQVVQFVDTSLPSEANNKHGSSPQSSTLQEAGVVGCSKAESTKGNTEAGEHSSGNTLAEGGVISVIDQIIYQDPCALSAMASDETDTNGVSATASTGSTSSAAGRCRIKSPAKRRRSLRRSRGEPVYSAKLLSYKTEYWYNSQATKQKAQVSQTGRKRSQGSSELPLAKRKRRSSSEHATRKNSEGLSTVSVGRDSPTVSVGRDSPTVSVGRDSPTVSVDRDSHTVSVGQDSDSHTVSVGRDSPTVSVGQGSPTVSVDRDSHTVSVGQDSDSHTVSVGRDSPTVSVGQGSPTWQDSLTASVGKGSSTVSVGLDSPTCSARPTLLVAPSHPLALSRQKSQEPPSAHTPITEEQSPVLPVTWMRIANETDGESMLGEANHRSFLPRIMFRRLDHHPSQWTVEDVGSFILGISAELVELFKDHEIDGEALIRLDTEMMVNCMAMKTGKALRIFKHITDLKRSYNILC